MNYAEQAKVTELNKATADFKQTIGNLCPEGTVKAAAIESADRAAELAIQSFATPDFPQALVAADTVTAAVKDDTQTEVTN